MDMHMQAELLRLAASVEAATRHPLADAVAAAAAAAGVRSPRRAEDAVTEPGCGVRGIVDGRDVAVGALEWVLQHCSSESSATDVPAGVRPHQALHAEGIYPSSKPESVPCSTAAWDRSDAWAASTASGSGSKSYPIAESASQGARGDGDGAAEGPAWAAGRSGGGSGGEWEERARGADLAGCTTVFVGERRRGVLGALGFRDALRPDAAATVAALRAQGLRVALLSGDNAAAVAAAAADAGIPVRMPQGYSYPPWGPGSNAPLPRAGLRIALLRDKAIPLQDCR